MARLVFFTLFLSFAAFLLASDSNLNKVPQTHRAAGVFLLIEGGEYTFNFTAARAACLSLNVTIATRHQVERALKHGLETCKYGWVVEQIAIIPRQRSDRKCGRGKLGVLTWYATADTEFGVFCINASDIEKTTNRPTTSAQSSAPPPHTDSTDTCHTSSQIHAQDSTFRETNNNKSPRADISFHSPHENNPFHEGLLHLHHSEAFLHPHPYFSFSPSHLKTHRCQFCIFSFCSRLQLRSSPPSQRCHGRRALQKWLCEMYPQHSSFLASSLCS
ncbi:lymphatic vessel endothelial hyaluronic receptor 1b [Cottoperca gobio]|uniref:Lymphatic vessel endothelial hyaluronic receptor 1b n=1 Tax=Cottoperca gobio TaxID=56716 RepID=A0A6J2PXK4_COTGO|nr:lymphatic vessel endothelial hyaluronic acid receptor 1-like [Cottoperca gobio]